MDYDGLDCINGRYKDRITDFKPIKKRIAILKVSFSTQTWLIFLHQTRKRKKKMNF